MRQERRRAFVYSLTVHAVLALLAIVGLPSFLRREEPPPPMVMSIDILPVSEISNVPVQKDLPLADVKEPKPEAEAKKSTPPSKVEDSSPSKPEPKPEPKPVEKPEPLPETKKEEKKPDPPKDDKKPEAKKDDKAKKPKVDDLDAVLKKLRDESRKKEAQETPSKKPAQESGARTRSEQHNAEMPLSMSEMDGIRSQVSGNWSMPAGAKNAQDLKVYIRIQLASDGTVLQASLIDESVSRYASGDSFYRAAADSALRAVRKSSPFKNLPPEKYATWRDIKMSFDPKELGY